MRTGTSVSLLVPVFCPAFGLTTVKIIILDDAGKVVHKRYERHQSQVFDKVRMLLAEVRDLGIKLMMSVAHRKLAQQA